MHLTAEPYTSPGLALLMVADDQPRQVSELQERARLEGYAVTSNTHLHTFAWRFVHRGLLTRVKVGYRAAYSITAFGQQYREATRIQLPPRLVRVLPLLTSEHQALAGLIQVHMERFGRTMYYARNNLLELERYGLVERVKQEGAAFYALTPLGEMAQVDAVPAYAYLGEA